MDSEPVAGARPLTARLACCTTDVNTAATSADLAGSATESCTISWPPRSCTAASSVPARTFCSAPARLPSRVMAITADSCRGAAARAWSSRLTRPTSSTLIRGVLGFL